MTLEIINDNTDAVLSELASCLDDALSEAGERAVDHAREELYNDPKRVDTGNLRDSITYSVDSDGVAIGTDVEYAECVHEGTTRMAPNRFLKNAIENNADEYKNIIKAHIID